MANDSNVKNKDRWFVAYEGHAAQYENKYIYHLYPAWNYDVGWNQILPSWVEVVHPKESVV